MKKVISILLGFLIFANSAITALAVVDQNYISIYCSQCGALTPAEGKFCSHCGAKIETQVQVLFEYEDVSVVYEGTETCNMRYGDMMVPKKSLCFTMTGENRKEYSFQVDSVFAEGYYLPFSISERSSVNDTSQTLTLSVDADPLLYFSSQMPSEITVVFSLEDSANNEVYQSKEITFDYSPLEWTNERRFSDNTELISSDEIVFTFLGIAPEGGHMSVYLRVDNKSNEEWYYSFDDPYINGNNDRSGKDCGFIQPRCTTLLALRFGDYIYGSSMPELQNLNTLNFSYSFSPKEYRSGADKTDTVEITFDECGNIFRIIGEYVFMEKPWANTKIETHENNTEILMSNQSSIDRSKPSYLDLDEVNYSISYPEANDYLDSYKTRYIKASTGEHSVYALHGLKDGSKWEDLAREVENNTKVVVIAEHSYQQDGKIYTYSCCIYSENGKVYSGWINNKYLVNEPFNEDLHIESVKPQVDLQKDKIDRYGIPSTTWNSIVKPDDWCWLGEPVTRYSNPSGGVCIYLFDAPCEPENHIGTVDIGLAMTVYAFHDTRAFVRVEDGRYGWVNTRKICENKPGTETVEQPVPVQEPTPAPVEEPAVTEPPEIPRNNLNQSIVYESYYLWLVQNDGWYQYLDNPQISEGTVSCDYYLCDIDRDGIDEIIVMGRTNAVGEGWYIICGVEESGTGVLMPKGIVYGRPCSSLAVPFYNTQSNVISIDEYHGGLASYDMLQIEHNTVTSSAYFTVDMDCGESFESKVTEYPWYGQYEAARQITAEDLFAMM